ncbi:MAG TPA: hypothetical protein VHZ51_08985 [Ktedonobacteraceae bacterium]|nr:hypothetical protein [Ktedonobacteraceae bacterium]
MSILHGLTLPDITRECLTDVVQLQIDLVDYAATTPIAQFGMHTCAAHLDREGSRFRGSGADIARWLCKPGTKRQRLLTTFACEYQAHNDDETTSETRAAWRKRIRQEIDALLSPDNEPLCVQSFFDESVKEKGKNVGKGKSTAPGWQQTARDFFLLFYENYLGNSKETFPACIFTQSSKRSFGRQRMLEAFLEENKGLEVCAICDQARYYAHGQQQIHSILDHYFPKAKYPHFSCHPYNLIPVCYSCNSSIKGEKDPLLDGRNHSRLLLKSALPYRYALSQQVYLEVVPSARTELITIGELQPRPNGSTEIDPELQQAIDLLREIYQFPARWGYADQATRINDTLFRSIRHFLADGRRAAYGADRGREIYHDLKHLLYSLDAEDQGHDPFAFAMTWILVALLKEAPDDAGGSDGTPTWRALVEEIYSWSGESFAVSQKRNKHVEKLLNTFNSSSEGDAPTVHVDASLSSHGACLIPAKEAHDHA